jgi:hypothetical protein
MNDTPRVYHLQPPKHLGENRLILAARRTKKNWYNPPSLGNF